MKVKKKKRRITISCGNASFVIITHLFPHNLHVGGPGKATLTYDNVNHGSCQLNPCEGVNATYLNTFRKDEGISVSYTKKEFWYIGKKWADRWASDKTLVPLDELYVGWLMLNNWFRITLDVQKTGDYTSDIYFTCPFGVRIISLSLLSFLTHGSNFFIPVTTNHYITVPYQGKLNFTLSNYATGAIVDEQIVDMPVTTYFHDWAILEKGVAFKNVPEGWNVLTITIADVGEDKKIHFGNFIWLDFKPLEL